MNCEDLKFNLSIYLDDVLPKGEIAVLDKHLAQCPLCRQKLADFRAMRNDLRMMSRPSPSAALLNSVRKSVSEEIGSRQINVPISATLREWKRDYFLPYSIGTAASLLIGFVLLWTLLSAGTGENFAKYDAPVKSTVLLTDSYSGKNGEFELSAADFARGRMSVSGQSPSINPHGALVALTKSFLRGEMKDDEVVIVADVFGDGLAKIAEVVEPSKDRRAIRELEKALRTDPDYAPPFVPASMDNRSATVRVVLKFQTVNVDIKTSSN